MNLRGGGISGPYPDKQTDRPDRIISDGVLRGEAGEAMPPNIGWTLDCPHFYTPEYGGAAELLSSSTVTVHSLAVFTPALMVVPRLTSVGN